ncbi:MAG: hypothetical protein ROR55_14020 [Devosia sp.]
MGTDIHDYVEVRQADGSWRATTADERTPPCEEGITIIPKSVIYGDRNYGLFAILADVRNWAKSKRIVPGGPYTQTAPFVPLSPPRGFPTDVSTEVVEAADWWSCEAYSHSHLTLKEVMEYDWTQEVTLRGWVTPADFLRHRLGVSPQYEWEDVSARRRVKVSLEKMTEIVGADANWSDLKRLEPTGSIFDWKDRYYTQLEWQVKYFEVALYFLGQSLPQLWRLGAADDVRLVFWFDN